jgi:hypothetical protein
MPRAYKIAAIFGGKPKVREKTSSLAMGAGARSRHCTGRMRSIGTVSRVGIGALEMMVIV